MDNTTAVSPPDREKCGKPLSFSGNGYVGFPAELFKTGGDELVRCMHHLLCNLWSLESMSSDCRLSLLCPVLKKGDATICSNNRGISLLTIAYRILSRLLFERLKPFVNKLIGSYQCGFRPGNPALTRSLRYAKSWRRHRKSRSRYIT